MVDAAFRRDTINFVVATAILPPKSETGIAGYLGGFCKWL
jgi:hypothetical protein